MSNAEDSATRCRADKFSCFSRISWLPNVLLQIVHRNSFFCVGWLCSCGFSTLTSFAAASSLVSSLRCCDIMWESLSGDRDDINHFLGPFQEFFSGLILFHHLRIQLFWSSITSALLTYRGLQTETLSNTISISVGIVIPTAIFVGTWAGLISSIIIQGCTWSNRFDAELGGGSRSGPSGFSSLKII